MNTKEKILLKFKYLQKYTEFLNKYKDITKNKPAVDSKPPLENWTCQGEMPKKRAEKRAKFVFLVKFLINKKKSGTVSVPRNAEGKRMANSFRPNIAIAGTMR